MATNVSFGLSEQITEFDRENPADGILPCQWIRYAIQAGYIQSDIAISANQVQPNSLDLRLGSHCHRVRCSFLPGKGGIDAALRNLKWYDVEIDAGEGTVLERDIVYLFPLQERLNLPENISARANPKSSTGRLDVFTRLVTESAIKFENVDAGYEGRLFLEVVPRSFPIRVRPGDSLAQIRFECGNAALSDQDTKQILDESDIVFQPVLKSLTPSIRPLRSKDLVVSDGIFLTVNLTSIDEKTIGFKAKKNTLPIDLRGVGQASTRHFWERIYGGLGATNDSYILEPDEFYIFASRELISLPPTVCAEMVPFDANSGELRTHYAGFFDSGFGYQGTGAVSNPGAAVVLEIRNRDVPFRIEANQPLFRFILMRNSAVPDMLYGTNGSNYQNQRLRLGKQFRMKDEDTTSVFQLEDDENYDDVQPVLDMFD